MVFRGGAAIKVDQQRAPAKGIPEIDTNTTQSLNNSYQKEYGSGDEFTLTKIKEQSPRALDQEMERNIMIGFP